MNKFEAMVANYLSKKGLDLNGEKDEIKAAKYALKLYNKFNGTSFKSKSPKIIIFKVNSKHNKKATA